MTNVSSNCGKKVKRNMAKPFSNLSEKALADPVRRARIEEIDRATGVALELAKLRESRDATQRVVADVLKVTQANVSRIEHESDLYLSTLRSYVEALGGRLEITAVFDDERIAIVDAQEATVEVQSG